MKREFELKKLREVRAQYKKTWTHPGYKSPFNFIKDYEYIMSADHLAAHMTDAQKVMYRHAKCWQAAKEAKTMAEFLLWKLTWDGA